MIIHREFNQGTLEWLLYRVGKPTASEFDNILTPEFKIRTGEMVRTYCAKKVAELWTGSPAPCFQSIDMDFGKILEEECIPYYTLMTGIEVEQLGFITTDDGSVGCSPDGWLPDGTGLEVKSPDQHTHVKYLLAGGVPKNTSPRFTAGCT